MAWFKSDRILAMRNIMISNNMRFTVSHDGDSWRFHIRDARMEDSGTYICQEDLSSRNPISLNDT